MDYADNFISAPDELAAYGMRAGQPAPGDAHIISGESGAALAWWPRYWPTPN